MAIARSFVLVGALPYRGISSPLKDTRWPFLLTLRIALRAAFVLGCALTSLLKFINMLRARRHHKAKRASWQSEFSSKEMRQWDGGR